MFVNEYTQSLVDKYGIDNLRCRHGHRYNKGHNKCFEDGLVHLSKREALRLSKVNHNCKILLYDIETTPNLALVWDLWNQNIQAEAVVNSWHLISWSAKWLFDDEIMSEVITPEEALWHDDSRLVKSMWKLLDEADVVIGHYCDLFDNKRMNTRFLYHGLPPVSHYQSVDTLLVAKKTFDFPSNKLDFINGFLGLPQKEKTDFSLWKRAWYGDEEALKTMQEYNINDVAILEDLFLKLRPYIQNLPNLNLWNEENVSICPACGSKNLDWNKHYYTYTGRYKAFRCKDCGALGRSRQLDIDKEKRKVIVR